MLPIDYLPGARRDFDESFDWYLQRSPKAALRFSAAIDAALARVAAKPEGFAAIDDVHRECRVETFPFRVVYRVSGECILVVAIAHAKRRPGYWKNRD